MGASLPKSVLFFCDEQDVRLLKAIRRNDAAGCHAAILSGANPNIRHPLTGWSAASNAAHHGASRCLEILIKAGADINLSGPYGITPLLRAAKRGDLSCVKKLISAGARLDVTTIAGITPAMRALRYGHAACLQALIRAGAAIPSRKYAIETISRETTLSGTNQAYAFMAWAVVVKMNIDQLLEQALHLDMKTARIVCAMINARRALRLTRRHKYADTSSPLDAAPVRRRRSECISI